MIDAPCSLKRPALGSPHHGARTSDMYGPPRPMASLVQLAGAVDVVPQPHMPEATRRVREIDRDVGVARSCGRPACRQPFPAAAPDSPVVAGTGCRIRRGRPCGGPSRLVRYMLRGRRDQAGLRRAPVGAARRQQRPPHADVRASHPCTRAGARVCMVSIGELAKGSSSPHTASTCTYARSARGRPKRTTPGAGRAPSVCTPAPSGSKLRSSCFTSSWGAGGWYTVLLGTGTPPESTPIKGAAPEQPPRSASTHLCPCPFAAPPPAVNPVQPAAPQPARLVLQRERERGAALQHHRELILRWRHCQAPGIGAGAWKRAKHLVACRPRTRTHARAATAVWGAQQAGPQRAV